MCWYIKIVQERNVILRGISELNLQQRKHSRCVLPHIQWTPSNEDRTTHNSRVLFMNSLITAQTLCNSLQNQHRKVCGNYALPTSNLDITELQISFIKEMYVSQFGLWYHNRINWNESETDNVLFSNKLSLWCEAFIAVHTASETNMIIQIILKQCLILSSLNDIIFKVSKFVL